MLVIPVGSVTAQTELTYEYGVRNKGKKPAEKTGSVHYCRIAWAYIVNCDCVRVFVEGINTYINCVSEVLLSKRRGRRTWTFRIAQCTVSVDECVSY